MHCHSPVNVRGWSVQCRVAVRQVRPGTLRPEWQCARVRSRPSGSATGAPGYAQARVAVQVTLPSGVERAVTVRSGSSGSATGTFSAEWQCDRRTRVRSVPSGSAGHTAKWRRACRNGTLRAEWQCDRYARVRSDPSGSAGHTAKWRRACRNGTLRVEWQCDRYARGRVAVRITLPLAGERAGVERSGPSGSASGTLRGSLAAHAGVCSRS